ncbi:MAG: endonuclease [Succinivibrionaceae bacterium]|nr:endonuclease [Succinivibrionaceae bacterium]
MAMRSAAACLCLLAFSLGLAAPAAAMGDFREAKRELPRIFSQLGDPRTLYCACPLTFRNGRYQLDAANCPYVPQEDEERAGRVEAEHIMPVYAFSRERPCWQEGRRQYCSAHDREFQAMEGDLHNLYPSVGEVNKERGSYPFGDLAGGVGLGSCPIIVDHRRRLVDPPAFARGIIARAYLYMGERYGVRMSRRERRLMERWDSQYAPTDDECLRNELIERAQGNDNPFVTRRCAARER